MTVSDFFRTCFAFLMLSVMGACGGAYNLWIRAIWRVKGVRIATGVVIRGHNAAAIQLSNGVCVGCRTLLISTIEKSLIPISCSRLIVGESTAINEYCNIRASGGEIVIGSKCLLAQFVTIIASNHGLERNMPIIDQYWSDSPHSVHIGDDVWIGAGVTILPGSRIGSGAVIAAGAVVRGEVPGEQIWGGVPARFLKMR